jgi:pSer/pThr/pTyr-binding forkhead associated (FHA) protein
VTDACAVFGPDGPFPLTGARVRVGRGRSNELVLHDASVSREHAELVPTSDGRGWRVRDLDSTNGVAVNGAKVRDQALALGDTVTFGSCEVRFDRWAGGGDH